MGSLKIQRRIKDFLRRNMGLRTVTVCSNTENREWNRINYQMRSFWKNLPLLILKLFRKHSSSMKPSTIIQSVWCPPTVLKYDSDKLTFVLIRDSLKTCLVNRTWHLLGKILTLLLFSPHLRLCPKSLLTVSTGYASISSSSMLATSGCKQIIL